MNTITLQTQSFLFESPEGQFRAMPFYELSNEEWVVYENEKPKYFIDLNQRTKPLIQDFITMLDSGESLEEAVRRIARFLGKEWTTDHNIQGKEIPDSHKPETITLTLLDSLADHLIELTFIATDEIDFSTLLNEEKLVEIFMLEDINGFLGLESAFIDNFENLKAMLSFLFKEEITFRELTSNNDKQVFDLTDYKDNCISTDELESNYPEWLKISGRRNTMGEYANLLCVIGYIDRNRDKKNLLLLIEKRRHYLPGNN